MKKNVVMGMAVSLVSLLAIAAFLAIGFTTEAWHIAWVVFLTIPAAAIVTETAAGKRNVAGAVTGIVSILAITAFLLMGFIGGLWFPGWTLLIAIPVSRIIAGMFTESSGASENAEGNVYTSRRGRRRSRFYA